MSEHITYGIIGNPLTHSLSPLMHNAAFKALKVDAVYTCFPLKEEEVELFVKDLRKPDSHIFGLNVTVPYKEKVLVHLDVLTPLVEKIGAVNTIVVTNQKKLIGYNTDAPGFLAHLAELQFNLRGKQVAILGAGGSARAILATLCMIPDRPDSVRLYNRTPQRAEQLLEDMQDHIDMSIVEHVNSIDDLDIPHADLLINTTSLGLNPGDPLLIDESLIHPRLLVYDLIYNPKETPLLKMARGRGAQVANGLGMLFYQGVLSFQHWANVQLDESIKIKMRTALEKGLK